MGHHLRPHRVARSAAALVAALVAVVMAVVMAGAAVLASAAPASAHVVPSTTITLAVHEDDITADLVLPAGDLATASGVDVPTDGAALDAAGAQEVADYLQEHTQVTSEDGAWQVEVADVATTAVEQWGTGSFSAVTATATLTPSDPGDLRTFVLDHDAIVHQVVTADVYVTLGSDDGAAQPVQARSLGTIGVDTVTGAVAPLPVDLTDATASRWRGFTGMVALGISHIAEGTDHQLFLLTLLLPAPLIASTARRRWDGVARSRTAVRRITTITLAFTLGHCVTLALGALGLPVPQQAVEAAIAASILVAAAHAARPIFPGREPLIAGLFGLVHGLAFSTTLTEMDLTGTRLALSLLGFNLGIEAMQLAVVLLVLPPLLVLASTGAYRYLRVGAAALIALAATGWLLQRLGADTPLGSAADAVGPTTPWIALLLWLAATAVTARRRRGTTGPPPRRPADHRVHAPVG